jgi:signal peptidase I
MMKKKPQSVFREYFEIIAETAVFVLFVMTFVVQHFQIPTGSMIPKLLIGDFLLVNKMAYARPVFPLERFLWPHKPIERKDIIVFKWPGDLTKDYVKRVIGLAGDKVEIRTKQLYVNGQAVDEPYTIYKDNPAYSTEESFGPIIVPEGRLFVMGDNRDDSADSRAWGFVPMANVKGRPWLIYFSYEAEPNAYQKTSLRDRLEKLVSFVAKARWRRLFKTID